VPLEIGDLALKPGAIAIGALIPELRGPVMSGRGAGVTCG
jgi:hypothetical protein